MIDFFFVFSTECAINFFFINNPSFIEILSRATFGSCVIHTYIGFLPLFYKIERINLGRFFVGSEGGSGSENQFRIYYESTWWLAILPKGLWGGLEPFFYYLSRVYFIDFTGI